MPKDAVKFANGYEGRPSEGLSLIDPAPLLKRTEMFVEMTSGRGKPDVYGSGDPVKANRNAKNAVPIKRRTA